MLQLPSRLHKFLESTFPKDWERVVAGELFKESSEKVSHSKDKSETIPVLSITMEKGLILQQDKFGKKVASRDHGSYKVVKSGDLVYGFPIDEGVIAFLDSPEIGAVSPVYAVWNLTGEADRGFLKYLLKSPAMIHVYKMLNSATVERRRILSKNDFRAIPLPLPSMTEQRAIADVLNAVRHTIDVTEALIAASQQLKRSLMEHLFTYGPATFYDIGKSELHNSGIGMALTHWEVSRLETVASITKKPRKINHKGLKPFIPMEMLPIGDIEIKNYEYRQNITSGIYCEAGDLLLARITPSFENGKQGFVPKTAEGFAYATTEVIPIKTSGKLDKFYLFYYLLNEPVRRYIAAKMEGTTGRQRVPKSVIKNLPIILPDLSTQKRVSEILITADTYIRQNKAKKAHLEKLFQNLLTNLITGKMRIN